MRVALELSQLEASAAHRGLGRYARAVVAMEPLLDDVTFLPFSVPLHRGRLGELVSMPKRLRSLWSIDADLQHSLSPYLLGFRPARPRVVSILDLIPLLVTCHQRTGLKARAVHGWAAKADSFLTISEFSRGQMVRTLGIPAERIVVAPLPPLLDDICHEPSEHLGVDLGDSPYAVAIADCRSPDPRKRLGWLPQVGSALADSGGRLVVIGADSELQFRGLRGVDALGLVGDGALRLIVRGARIFVFPSAYEGQGLPPLEAMSFGVPPVTMANTSLPEVVGGGGLLVEEESPDWALNACRAREQTGTRARFVEACAGLFADASRRSLLATEAIAHAASFDRSRFARGMRSAYEIALAGPA